jgi:hypothetical protein
VNYDTIQSKSIQADSALWITYLENGGTDTLLTHIEGKIAYVLPSQFLLTQFDSTGFRVDSSQVIGMKSYQLISDTLIWDATKTDLHDAATLTGTGDYLTLSGQQFTKSLIDTTSSHINRSNWETYINSLSSGSLWTQSGSDIYYNDGNVGIGTSSPEQILQVVSSGVGPLIEIKNDRGTGGAGFQFTDTGSSSSWRMKTTFFGDFKIRNNKKGYDVFYIDSLTTDQFSIINNNVGIGTTSPAYKLDVAGTASMEDSISGSPILTVKQNYVNNPALRIITNGSSATNSAIQIRDNTTNKLLWYNDGWFEFAENTSEVPYTFNPASGYGRLFGYDGKLWYRAGGNLYDLTAGGTGGGASNFLELTDTPASYSGQSGKFVKVNSTSNGLEFATSTGASPWTEQGYGIDYQSGNVGIGAVAAQNTGLTIYDSWSSGGAALGAVNTSSTGRGAIISGNSTSISYPLLQLDKSSTSQFTFIGDGSMYQRDFSGTLGTVPSNYGQWYVSGGKPYFRYGTTSYDLTIGADFLNNTLNGQFLINDNGEVGGADDFFYLNQNLFIGPSSNYFTGDGPNNSFSLIIGPSHNFTTPDTYSLFVGSGARNNGNSNAINYSSSTIAGGGSIIKSLSDVLVTGTTSAGATINVPLNSVFGGTVTITIFNKTTKEYQQRVYSIFCNNGTTTTRNSSLIDSFGDVNENAASLLLSGELTLKMENLNLGDSYRIIYNVIGNFIND